MFAAKLKRIFLASDDYEIVNRLVEYFEKEKLVCSFFSGLFHSMTLNKQAETRAVNNKWSATKTSNGLVVHFQNNVSLQTLHLWVPPMVYQLLHFFLTREYLEDKNRFLKRIFFFFKAEQLDVQLYFMSKRAPGVLFECRPWMLVQSAFKDCTISTVPITCDFKSECLSGQAVPWECDWGSLLCVILKFLPLTKQKAVRSCQHFSLVLVVAPMPTCWSYHRWPVSDIQLMTSLLENRTMRVHPSPICVISQ